MNCATCGRPIVMTADKQWRHSDEPHVIEPRKSQLPKLKAQCRLVSPLLCTFETQLWNTKGAGILESIMLGVAFTQAEVDCFKRQATRLSERNYGKFHAQVLSPIEEDAMWDRRKQEQEHFNVEIGSQYLKKRSSGGGFDLVHVVAEPEPSEQGKRRDRYRYYKVVSDRSKREFTVRKKELFPLFVNL